MQFVWSVFCAIIVAHVYFVVNDVVSRLLGVLLLVVLGLIFYLLCKILILVFVLPSRFISYTLITQTLLCYCFMESVGCFASSFLLKNRRFYRE